MKAVSQHRRCKLSELHAAQPESAVAPQFEEGLRCAPLREAAEIRGQHGSCEASPLAWLRS